MNPSKTTGLLKAFRSLPVWLTFCVLTVLYVFLNGYDYLLGPQEPFITKIMSIKNPDLFQNDFLTNLRNKFYTTYSAWPLAYLNQWFDMKWMFFIGHFITTVFYLAGIFYISKTLLKDTFMAFLSVLAIFFIKPVFLDASLYPTIFYHRNIAWGLQLFAIHFFLKRRLPWAALLLGLSFNVSVYTSVHLFMLFAFAMLIRWRGYSLRETIKVGIVFATVASPIFYWSLTFEEGASLGIASSEWLSYLRLAAPGYLFPSSFLNPETGKITTLLMVFVWPFYYLASFARGYLRWEGIHRTVAVMMLGVPVLFVVATIFGEIIPISVVLKLMIFRVHKFFVLFAILYFVHYIVSRFREEKGLLENIFLAVLVTAFLNSKMILCTALAAADFLLLTRFCGGKARDRFRTLILLSIATVALFPAAVQPALLQRLFHLDIPFIAVCLATLLLLRLYSHAPSAKSGRMPIMWVVFTAVFVFTLLPTYWGVGRAFTANPLGTLYKQVEWPWTSPLNPEQEQLLAWVRDTTPQDACFLVPSHDLFINRYFIGATLRGTVASRIGVLSILSLSYGRQWYKRGQDVEMFPSNTYESRYLAYSTEKIDQISDKYPLHYFLTLRESKSVDFPIVYEDSTYVVYKVRDVEKGA